MDWIEAFLVGHRTPGRILGLVKGKEAGFYQYDCFLFRCDRMLEALDMRKDIQEIFRTTPTRSRSEEAGFYFI